jgi:hypothetical protein
MFDNAVPPTADALPSEQVNHSHDLAHLQAAMRARAEEHNAPGVDPKLRPFSVNDLMILHNLSRRTIIRLYENESGVEVLPDLRPPGKRRCHRTFRVPRHVYLRVRNRMTVR